MKAFRIDLSAWTASFRYPNLLSGVQPTLEAPPLSTVLGLLNAAAGRYLVHDNLEIGYYFEFAGKEFDLETIYQIEEDKGRATNKAKSNVMKREFLFEPKLSIYLTDATIAELFRQPVYQLLMGRSSDLATVDRIVEIELLERIGAEKIRGQVVPLEGNMMPGVIQALPRYFSNTFPRQNIGTAAFSIISHYGRDTPSRLVAWRDNTQGKGGADIFFHQFSIADYV
jgi:CRISPR-associated protein Cas5t